jgi:penicillin-binding protein A
MRFDNKPIIPAGQRPDWRKYQEHLKKDAAGRRLTRKIAKWGAVTTLLVVIVGLFLQFGGPHDGQNGHGPGPAANDPAIILKENAQVINKSDIRVMLAKENLLNLDQKRFKLNSLDQHLEMDTSLDMKLQKYIIAKLDRRTSRHIGLISMDPSTGKILAMVGFDKTGTSSNPCIDNRFPAASIFKIVTAAAAIELHDFKSDTNLTFNGGKYTLYKSQIKERNGSHTNRISFKDAFAQSVNPVFGKIGALRLGKKSLEKYATNFGFNSQIHFELPISPSLISITDEPYHWAEIACGYNRQTTLSPLHAAMISAAIVNRGQMIEPTIIDRIIDENGNALYQRETIPMRQTIRADSATKMIRLMNATITSGTGRKIFRGHSNDKVLSRLNIGGKSGSIDNKSHDARYDWFVGFAMEKDGDKKIIVSAVVAHEKFIGVRAGAYVKMAIKKYFENYFAEKDKKA